MIKMNKLFKDLVWAGKYILAKNDLPLDLVLAITYNCNSRCRMCNIWKSEPLPILGLAEYEKLPASLKEINLTGGEPFLRPDLLELIKVLLQKNPQVRIIISSNGFATDLIKTKLQEILKIKPDIILSFSLDGVGELHDQVRGIPGGYNKVMATIAVAKELGVKEFRLAFTAGDYNILHLVKVYNLAKELGAEFTMAAVHNADNYFNIADNAITKLAEFKSEFTQIIKAELSASQPKNWFRAFFVYALYEFLVTGKRILPNYSGQDNIFIDPLGNVYPSDVSGHVMGNLQEFTNFEQLYESKIAEQAIAVEKLAQNWMMCTARSAMKRHLFQVLLWILKAKLFGIKL